MAYFDAAFWSNTFRDAFVRHIRAFERAVVHRFIPTFDAMDQEATQVTESEYRRLGTLPGDENVDMGDLADSATNAGIEHYAELASIKQSLLNLSATALFHLYEQQLLMFHRRQVLDPREEDDEKLFHFKVICARLLAGGVDVKAFKSWKRMEALEALANAVKHGDGKSAQRLGSLRPELLIFPPLRSEDRRIRPSRTVFLPLAGDSIYVTVEDFQSFSNDVVEFWNEMADSILSAQSTE